MDELDGIIVAVDPGIAGCGVALAVEGKIHHARYVRNPAGAGRSQAARCAYMARKVGLTARSWVSTIPFNFCVQPQRVVLEWPQVRAAGKGRGDPNDLLFLAGVDAAIGAELFPWDARCVVPREWKGTIPPDVLISRVQDRLSEEERARVILPAKSLAHNVWDAVGIALWTVGRLAPHRVIARE